MKTRSLFLVALVAVTCAGVAQAGPASPLYLTIWGGNIGYIVVVQGNSVINYIPDFYAGPTYGNIEYPIAVSGDVRTTGLCCGIAGGQYTLGGTPTGTTYVLPGGMYALDSTTDGTHNYLVDGANSNVYQTARDYTNPVLLFTSSGVNMGITYDPANHSLWISGWDNTMVTDYSMNGTVISSFSTGKYVNGALAYEQATNTLWLVDVNDTESLQQYSTTGQWLSSGPIVGPALGGEFNFTPVPEPGTLIMFGSAVLGLAGFLRRKIDL